MILVCNRSAMQGFTLIELMIVMLIMGLMLSMVGGLGVRNVERSQVKTEVLQLQNWSKKMAFKAFNSGVDWQVQLAGHVITISPNTHNSSGSGEPVESLHFDKLFFQPQTVLFSRMGRPDKNLIHYSVGGKDSAIQLLDEHQGVTP